MYIVVIIVKSSDSKTQILVVRNVIQGGGGQLERSVVRQGSGVEVSMRGEMVGHRRAGNAVPQSGEKRVNTEGVRSCEGGQK